MKKTTNHPLWATKYRTPGTELRFIKNRYYLYEYKTVYDTLNKKPKKVSGKCLGSITERDGFKESLKIRLSKSPGFSSKLQIAVKEYGMSYLVFKKFDTYAQCLQQFFPEQYKQLIAIAYCRFVYRCPLKSIPFRLEASFLYNLLEMTSFNEKTSSAVLHSIGGQANNMQGYMKSFITEDDYILLDGTSIVSKSENMPISKKGYNKNNNYDGQINLLYVYSASTRMPVFYRLLDGNIRDVKAFKNTLALSGITKAIIVADKGFYSKENITLLKAENLSYIIPLKRDNKQVDYSSLADNSYKKVAQFFTHEKRIVWYLQIDCTDCIIHLFLDDSLKLKEESDYLTRTKNNPETNTLDKYYGKRDKFGTIALLTEKDLSDSVKVYQTYKSRMFIETMFDGMKNVLEADHTYMQNQQTLEGWMFINHLCLQWYQELYCELKDKELIANISVNDYIQLLTDIKKVKVNDNWYMNEFTAATGKLLTKIGLKDYNT